MQNPSANNDEFNEKRILELENRIKLYTSIINNLLKGEMDRVEQILPESNGDEVLANLKNLFAADKFAKTLKKQVEDSSYSLLKNVLESMPFPVFIKDENYTYLIINKAEVNLFSVSEQEILGKKDADFIEDFEELAIIYQSDEEALKYNKEIELPFQKFTLKNGKSYVFQTHKISFLNPVSGCRNILGFSIDVSDTVHLEHLKKALMLSRNPVA